MIRSRGLLVRIFGLRRGLRDMNDRPRRRERFRTTSVTLGRIRTGVGIDNITEVLAIAEGEGHK
jgi:hypothetical protein